MSARLDGETTDGGSDGVDVHLLQCAECRAFERSAAALHRSLRVRPAEPVPDLTAAIMAQVPARPSASAGAAPREWPRYALLAVALTQLIVAVPKLVEAAGGSSGHVTRELSAWDIALGIGLLLAAWQPRRAAGLLPFAAALAAALAATAVLDVAAGRVPVAGEAHHVLDIAGLIVLWVLARTPLVSRSRTRLTTA